MIVVKGTMDAAFFGNENLLELLDGNYTSPPRTISNKMQMFGVQLLSY